MSSSIDLMDNSQNFQHTSDDTHPLIEDSNNPPSPKCSNTLICVCVLLIALSFVLVYIAIPFICIASIIVSPLLLISIIITRLLQFVRDDNDTDYTTTTSLKHHIRSTLCVNMLIIILGFGMVFYPIIVSVPRLKHLVLLDLPISKWILVTLMACGFYILSYVVYLVLHFALQKRVNPVVGEAIYEIIDSFIFWWAVCEVVKRVPTFKHHQVLGFQTRNWILVALLLLVGYNLISLLTQMIVSLLKLLVSKEQNSKHWCSCNVIRTAFQEVSRLCWHISPPGTKKNIVYYAAGTKNSIDFVLSALMLLVTWVFVFGSHLNEPTSSKFAQSVWKFGFWSLVSVLICAFLWLLKTCLLLIWMARRVYDSFYTTFVERGKDLCFLIAVNLVIEKLEASEQDKESEVAMSKDMLQVMKLFSPQEILEGEKQDYSKLKDELTLDDVKRAAKILLETKSQFCDDKFTFVNKIKSMRSSIADIKGEIGKMIIEDEKNLDVISCCCCSCIVLPWIFFQRKLSKKPSGSCKQNNNNNLEDITGLSMEGNAANESLDNVIKRVECAYTDYMLRQNFLSSAKEVGISLNRILSVLVLSLTFIIWLLLNKLATTKVLVVIASPILAGSFIFGDTCKALFQGFIFAFVVNPINIGDVCVIDDKMMEVKSYSIWRTTFTKVSQQEEVSYSNSELFNKSIINHKTDIDWNDRVEFDNVGSLDEKDDFDKLKQDIEELLKESTGSQVEPRYTCVEVLEKEEKKTNIAIDFRFTIKETTSDYKPSYLERLHEKKKLRSKIIIEMRKFLDERSPNNSDDGSSSNKIPIQSTEEKPEDEENVKTEDCTSKNEDKKAKGVAEIIEEGKQN